MKAGLPEYEKKEFSKDFELTYKKRYPIPNGVIQDALEVAKKKDSIVIRIVMRRK